MQGFPPILPDSTVMRGFRPAIETSSTSPVPHFMV
jgi:hypothetical protein